MQCNTFVRRAALVAAAALSLSGATSATAATPTQVQDAVNLGATWLAGKQDPASGGILDFGGDFALSSLAAAGRHLADVKGPGAGDPTAQDYVVAHLATDEFGLDFDPVTNSNDAWGSVNELAKWTLFSNAAGVDPARAWPQVNLVAQLAATYKPGTGAFGGGLANTHLFALMAVAQGGVPQAVITKAVDHLRLQQHDDGGFNYGAVTTPAQAAAAGDPDMTGAAIAAFCAAGVAPTDPDVQQALALLKGRLLSTGAIQGGPFVPAQNADTNAWVVSGLNACGIDPQGAEWTSTAGKNPIDFLISLQRPSSSATNPGAFKYVATDANSASVNLYAHQDVLRALAGEAFSATPPARLNALNPRFRPNAAPAAGTITPHAIVVDDAAGDVRFCRVSFGVGASLSAVLAAAKTGTAPGGCVTEFTLTGGLVASVNGKAGGWLVSINGEPSVRAGVQTVGFGDIVSLRHGPADPVDPDPPVTTTTTTTVTTTTDIPTTPTTVPTTTPTTPVTGTDVPKTATKPAVTGCKTDKKTKLVTCKVTGAGSSKLAKVTLTKNGKTYAKGSLSKLRGTRKIKPGTYRLTIKLGKKVTTAIVKIK